VQGGLREHDQTQRVCIAGTMHSWDCSSCFFPRRKHILRLGKNTEWGQHFPTPVALVTTVPPNPMTEATATRQFGTQSPSPS
jgi:hypothetical protein